MKIYFWLPIAILLGFGATAQAQPPFVPGPMHSPYSAPSRVNPSEQAVATLREGMHKLLDFLGEKEKPNKLQLAAFLDSSIAPYFDFDYMAKWVAGRRYAAMTPKQRTALAASLEARFLGSLATNLAKYKGQQIRYFRPRRGASGAVSVTVGLRSPGSYPARLQFRMYRSGDGWKIYDVISNGRSAVAFYRQELRRSSMQGSPGAYGR
jgi:phospholipid transport system substrate-binding protein